MQATVAPHYRIRILAIDPGSQISGFACLACQAAGNCRPEHMDILEVGVARFNKNQSFTGKIGDAFELASKLIATYQPTHCSIEKAFYGENISTAMKLGEIRGAFIAAFEQAKLPITQITPAEVKKHITGNGRATKQDVAFAVSKILKADLGDLPFDAADALAIALSCAMRI
ncbi:MAG: crossover junction endodeoxyribonuclease RuvC [Oligoflexales bacterium]|nr:crossover junction endodeoxyribonuclease RuvC [Oligoflexales bacterium]